MGRIISIASQKGGVGKTTTAINLGACLAQESRRVLLVDMDPQGNMSSGVGVTGDDQRNTSYEVLLGEVAAREAILPTALATMDLMPTGQRLSGAEVELVAVSERESRLKSALASVRDEYDFILVDSPPSLGLLTVNSLNASDSVIIPLQCEYLALEGLTQIMKAITLIQNHLNPSLRIEGVLLTMYDARVTLSKSVAEDARKLFSNRVYKTMIPRNVRLSEAPSHGKPIVLYDPHCVGAESYRELAREVLEHV
jgi:chromosome partitioning protein